MENKKIIAIASLLITVFLLFSILMIGSLMNDLREDDLNEQFGRMSRDIYSMQMLSLLSETYGEEMACIAIKSKIQELDKYIWTLGDRIEKYRTATEEFYEDEYYLSQKEIFNENEVFYLLLLKKMAENCDIDKRIVLFFYRNSVDCSKCDDQSFILSDINELDEQSGFKEVAIFSFDMDLNLTSLEILKSYYGIEEYPCLIINEEKHCRIQDRGFIMEKICTDEGENPDICDRYYD